MGISNFFNKSKKIILIPLAAVMFSTAVGAAGNSGDEVIAGTKHQIEEYFKHNPSALSDYHKSDAEALISTHQESELNFSTPYNWSFNFDNKGGMADKNHFEREFYTLLNQSINNILLNIAQEIPSEVRKSVKDQRQLLEIIKKSFNGEIIIKGSFKGYSSPEGDIHQNSDLGQKRAEEARDTAKKIFEKEIKQWFANQDIKIKWEPSAESHGIITNHYSVKKVVDKLNETLGLRWQKIDWAKILKQDKNELNKFTQAFRVLEKSNPRLYKELINQLSPTRKININLKVELKGKIEAVVIKTIPHETPLLSNAPIMPPSITAVDPPPHHFIREISQNLDKIHLKEKPIMRSMINKNLPRQPGKKGTGGKFVKL